MITDDEAIAMHKALSNYHGALARDAILDIIHEYHDDLAQRLAVEVDQIPERAEANARWEARRKEEAAEQDNRSIIGLEPMP